MKVLFLANVPAPYRVDFFNELGKYCELTVLFEKRTSDERDTTWKNYEFQTFQGVFLCGQSISTDAAVCPSVISYIKQKQYDVIICTTFTDPTGMMAVQYMKAHGIHYYLECDGGFAKNGRGIKEKVKKHFIQGAEGYFSTGKYCDEYYLQYGAKQEKLIRYPFASLHEADIMARPMCEDEKKKLKERLHIREDKAVLAVGQFIYRKGFDVLLDAAKNLPNDVGVYFVGGDATNEYLSIQRENHLENVHFVGFKAKKELAQYYLAADVFVLPTREDIWGLVIGEAMAFGLPVITTNKCAAGVELISGNGFIVDPDNSPALSKCINTVLKDSDLREEMAIRSLSQVRRYSIEQMTRVHVDYLQSKHGKPQKRAVG